MAEQENLTWEKDDLSGNYNHTNFRTLDFRQRKKSMLTSPFSCSLNLRESLTQRRARILSSHGLSSWITLGRSHHSRPN